MSTSAEGSFGQSTASAVFRTPAYQAYQILHIGFVVAAVIAGLDKFSHLLVNWDLYLAPAIARPSPIGGDGLMQAVGVLEIIGGILVAFKPRIGAYVVVLCLWGIILNLILIPNYFDVALRLRYVPRRPSAGPPEPGI